MGFEAAPALLSLPPRAYASVSRTNVPSQHSTRTRQKLRQPLCACANPAHTLNPSPGLRRAPLSCDLPGAVRYGNASAGVPVATRPARARRPSSARREQAACAVFRLGCWYWGAGTVALVPLHWFVEHLAAPPPPWRRRSRCEAHRRRPSLPALTEETRVNEIRLRSAVLPQK